MKRWIAWFAFGGLLFVLASSAQRAEGGTLWASIIVTGLALWGWLLLTIVAFGVSAVRWLVGGRRSRAD